jgi:hypothetical protein
MRLKNTSTLTLEDGPMTVIDGDSYAGEALLGRFKPGERRLVSFALDLGTLITFRSDANREPVLLAKALNGVLQVSYFQVDKRVYKLVNQTDKSRIIYIEHPKRADWKLIDETQKPVDDTQNFYRYRVELKPRETVELPVNERHQITDSYTISSLTRADVDGFIARGAIDDSLRTVLEKILAIKNRIGDQEARIAAIEAEKTQIGEDQERLRENINALKNTAEARQLIVRYVSKANEQETRIEELTKDQKTAEVEKGRLQAELSAAFSSIVIERKE